MHDRGALGRIIGLIDMKMDEAFAARIGSVRCFKFDKPTRSVTPYYEYRMNKRADFETAAAELADNRIHQERHVVIDDFKHRDAARAGERLEPYLGSSGAPLGKKGPRLLGDVCEFRRAAVPQIFGRSESEQFADKTVRYVRLPLGQELGGGRDQRGSTILVSDCRIGLSVHLCSAYDAQ
jgi:hypothetical protein